MKKEHSQLSREAHECADSIPELNKMLEAVQALGNVQVSFFLSFALFLKVLGDMRSFQGLMDCFTVAQCEDLKMKYSEEQAQRKKFFNEVQEAKGIFSILQLVH